MRDLARPLADGAGLEIVTTRAQDALELIRHDAAHVLATAVMELYPGVKISIGPPIEDGFYYDFEFPEGVTVSEADFPAIEERMREHIEAARAVRRARTSTVGEALERFRAEHQDYKVELIEDLVRDRASTPSRSTRTAPFTDLCRGPHAPDTGASKAFKLQSVAGAYWRGDASRPMLTRIYGTAFFSKKELDAQLERLEQARARDHRKLGRELELFTFSEVSPGLAVLAAEGHGDLERARRLCARDGRRARLHRGQDAAALRQPSCGRPRATGASTARTCSSPRPRAARSA